MSAFWKHYASVSDDVRHKLVEEGWFGRQVTGNITEQDMPGIAPEAPPPPTHGLYAEVWGKEPQGADLHGKTPDPGSTPAIAPPQTQDEGHAPEL